MPFSSTKAALELVEPPSIPRKHFVLRLNLGASNFLIVYFSLKASSFSWSSHKAFSTLPPLCEASELQSVSKPKRPVKSKSSALSPSPKTIAPKAA